MGILEDAFWQPMLSGMRIEERLEEIAAELGIPPRTASMTMEDWFRRVDDYCATCSWSSQEWQLIKEMFQLRREYEEAKAKP